MKVIRNRFIPFGHDYFAVNILGVVFAKEALDSHALNHEYIHTMQQKEMLYLFFFLWYAVEWLFRLAQYRSFFKAYTNVSFEREAYANMYNLHYPHQRRHFSWLTHYIVKH
ncbi:MAG: hypothetical protein MJZ08_07315 [Bacteroidaceae bacterium]|nr:hypothetical protein [Bacteroidaceae bacterium]